MTIDEGLIRANVVRASSVADLKGAGYSFFSLPTRTMNSIKRSDGWLGIPVLLSGLVLLAASAAIFKLLFASRPSLTTFPPPSSPLTRSSSTLSIPTPNLSSPGLLPSHTPTPTEADPTFTWKLYVNAQQGYSIKYPPDWHAYPNVIPGPLEQYRGTEIASYDRGVAYQAHIRRTPDLPAEEAYISLLVLGNDKSPERPLSDYVTTHSRYPGDRLLEDKFVIAGTRAIEQQSGTGLGSTVYFANRNVVYSVFIPSNRIKKHQATINLMLSTIRFVPSAD